MLLACVLQSFPDEGGLMVCATHHLIFPLRGLELMGLESFCWNFYEILYKKGLWWN